MAGAIMSTPIVERLRTYRPYKYDVAGNLYPQIGNPCGEAASIIEDLLAALEPFARLADNAERDAVGDKFIEATGPITDEDYATVTMGKLRKARGTIAKVKGGAQ